MSRVILIFRIMKKHLVTIFLISLLTGICLYTIGVSFDKKDESQQKAAVYEETYGINTLYRVHEFLSDNSYYNFLESDDDQYLDFLNFYRSLSENESLNYIVDSQQNFQIIDMDLPDEVLFGYEDGNIIKTNMYDGKTLSSAKGLQVSPNFFSEYSIHLSSGTEFTDEDYIINPNEPIPVLLGSVYKDIFSIGDEFQSLYIYDEYTMVVKGFLDDNCFFYNDQYDDIVSCSRYIISPAFVLENDSESARRLLLDHFNGFMDTDLGYEIVQETFENLKSKNHLSRMNIYVTLQDDSKQLNTIETYSSMTKEVSRQFNLILLLTILLATATISAQLGSLIRKEFRYFAIAYTNGASVSSLSTQVCILISFMIGIGDLSASVILTIFHVSITGIFILQVISLGLIIFTSITSIFTIRHLDFASFLGGKE